MLRTGRLDLVLYVSPPDEKGRLEIIKILTKKMPLAIDSKLARKGETVIAAIIKIIKSEPAIWKSDFNFSPFLRREKIKRTTPVNSV